MTFDKNVILFCKAMIDLSYYETIGDGNKEFLKDILLTFQVEVPLFITELKEAVSTSNSDKIRKLIHKIKPAWMVIGLPIEPFEIVSSDSENNREKALQHIVDISITALEEIELRLAELNA